MLAARSLKHLKDGHASFPSSSTPAYASSSFPSRGPPASEGRLYGPMHGSMNPNLSSGYGGNFQSHLLPPGYQSYPSYGNIREMHSLAPAFPPYHPGPGAFHMQHVYPNNAGLTDVPSPLPAPSSYPPFPSPSSVAALDGPGSMVRDTSMPGLGLRDGRQGNWVDPHHPPHQHASMQFVSQQQQREQQLRHGQGQPYHPQQATHFHQDARQPWWQQHLRPPHPVPQGTLQCQQQQLIFERQHELQQQRQRQQQQPQLGLM